MEHLKLKAVATATTDLGEFEAVISTEAADREGDVVVAGAMVKALRAWTNTGKLVPLAWNHSIAAEDQVGHIDPATVEEVNGEVVAGGKVDLDADRGRHTWRLMKSGTLGFSFGYMVLDAVKRADGMREIRSLDVFEVSATTVPMNAGTRVLATKALDDEPDLPSHAELECELIRAGIIARPANYADYQRLDPAVTATGPNGDEREKALPDQPPSEADQRSRLALLTDPELARVREEAREQMLTLLTTPTESESKAIEASIKAQQPVRIVSFEC